MNKPWTYEDVLRQLGGEPFLVAWLAGQGVRVSGEEGEAGRHDTHSLKTALDEVDDVPLRDRLKAQLRHSAMLGYEGARPAMLDAAAGHPRLLAALRARPCDLYRSVWLYVHYRAIFERAWMLDLMQAHGYGAMQYQIGRGELRVDAAALAALCEDAQALYQQLYGRGDCWSIHSTECAPGVIRLCIEADDELLAPALIASGALQRYGHSRLYMVLEHAQDTGVLRVVAPGQSRCHHALMRAVSHRLLGKPRPEYISDLSMLDLSALAGRLEPPDVIRDGFTNARLTKIVLRRNADPATIIYEPANWSDTSLNVRDRMVEDLGFDPFQAYWMAWEATLTLRLPGGHSEIEVQLCHNGASNLYRFEPEVQRRIEGFLIGTEVMKPHQALYLRLVDGDVACEPEGMEVS